MTARARELRGPAGSARAAPAAARVRPLGRRRQLAVTFVLEPSRVVGVVVDRPGTELSADDRDRLDLLGGAVVLALQLIAAWQEADRRAAERQDGVPGRLGDRALRARGISPREGEVLREVAEGGTNAQIARTLGISPRTVQKHLEHVFAKLGVSTRTAAVAAVARRAG